MKRKSGRKSAKKEEERNNDEESTEQNGDASENEEEAPKEKRRKSGRKNVSFTAKKDEVETAQSEEASESSEIEEDVKEEKKSKGRKSSAKKETEASKKDLDPLANSEDEIEESEKKKSSKKTKKAKEKVAQASESEEDGDEDDETQYEVEAVLDDKNVRGVKHYLIRWKGYGEESDTWEPEDTLQCKDLLSDYKNKKENKLSKRGRKKIWKDKEPDWDENENFEVDRILEVHFKKNGKREFLVSWKGYPATDNSWEPEDNMDCKDLIQKFMEKVDQAKQFDERELRANRKQVQRYTLTSPDTGRRISKRFSGKERVQYHDAE